MKPHFLCSLSAGIFFALGNPLHAFIDLNLDGMPDVWQLNYPATLNQPSADPDGDGRTNLQESIDGTDPGNPNSVFKVSLIGLSSTTALVSWNTVPGKRYQVYASGDLAAWTRLGPQQLTAQPSLSYIAPATTAQQFYRVQQYESLDSDSDGLTDLEEAQLGTNPLAFDTDGDHVPDDIELMIGTDPRTSASSSGDGLPDDFKRWIIYAAQHDNNPAHAQITSLADVRPGDSFSGDGITNLQHFSAGTSPVTRKKNVVLIYSDDLGYTLGCLGTPGISTPATDSIASSGVNFIRGFSATAVCSPSRAAILTGVFPHANGLYTNVPNYGLAFPLVGDPSDLGLGGVHEDLPTLIEILHDRHIYTAISQKTHVQPIRKFPFDFGSTAGSTPAAFTTLVNNVVANAGNRPFFIEANIGAPHRPFESHLTANGLLGADGNPTTINVNSIAVFPWLADNTVIRSDCACYFGAVQVADSCAAAVLNALQSNGVAGDTLVIFSGDNGPGFHRAKNTAYPAGTHMPFLVSGPGVVGGRTTKAPVSQIDVAPTILEFLNIPVPPTMQGRSLWPILSGSQEAFPDRPTMLACNNDYYTGRAVCDGRYYFIHNITEPLGTFAAPPMNADLYDLTTWKNRTYGATTSLASSDPYHYNFLANIVNGNLPAEELYDLDSDLWGVTNLINQPELAGKADQLRRALRSWRYATEDVNTSAASEVVRRTLRAGTFPGSPPPPTPAYSVVFADSFTSKSGNLDADPLWTTQTFGTSGTDFSFTANSDPNIASTVIKAAPGSPLIATASASTTQGQGYTASVDIIFPGDCVWNGLVFGFKDSNNFYSLELQETAGAGQGTAGSRQVVRVRKRSGGTFTTQLSATQASLADPARNTPYRLTVTFLPSTNTFNFSLFNVASSTLVWTGSMIDSSFTSGGFGIIADISGGGEYDNFSVSVASP